MLRARSPKGGLCKNVQDLGLGVPSFAGSECISLAACTTRADPRDARTRDPPRATRQQAERARVRFSKSALVLSVESVVMTSYRNKGRSQN